MLQTLNDNQVRFAGIFFSICLLVCALVLCSCASSDNGSQAPGSDSAGFTSSASDRDLVSESKGITRDTPYFKKLKSILGKEKAEKFLVTKASDPGRYWIATHLDAYAKEGDEVRERLLRLAADEDEAVPFVREYPKRYPSEFGQGKASAIDENGYPEVAVGNKNVPHFYQWDQRWGYTVYSSSAFGLAGCAPTALAMAYQATIGRDDLTPHDAAVLAQESGFMDEWEGTYQEFPYSIAEQLGMYSEVLPVGAYDIEHALSLGFALVANVQPGYFSHTNGHFIVIAGLTEDGKVVINDPYSVENSKKTWDIDFIVGETMMVCGFANPAVE